MTNLKSKGIIYLVVKNNGAAQSNVKLFSNSLTPLPFVSFAGSSVDYEFLNNMIHNYPMKINAIEYSSFTSLIALNLNIDIKRFNANGEEIHFFELPNIHLDINQKFSNFSLVKYKNLVLDGRTEMTFSLSGKKTLALTMYYEMYKTSDQLWDKPTPLAEDENYILFNKPQRDIIPPIIDRMMLRGTPKVEPFLSIDDYLLDI